MVLLRPAIEENFYNIGNNVFCIIGCIRPSRSPCLYHLQTCKISLYYRNVDYRWSEDRRQCKYAYRPEGLREPMSS